MIDVVLGFGLSNLCLSALMAVAAWTVQKKTNKPLLAHLLWLLVLVKLLTPSFITIPLLQVPGEPSDVLAELEATIASNALAEQAANGMVPVNASLVDGMLPTASEADEAGASWLGLVKQLAVSVWLFGSAAILMWSLWRVWQFHQLLKSAAVADQPLSVSKQSGLQPSNGRLQRIADRQAQRLGLTHAPQVMQVAAQIPPMVWWVGQRARIVLPAQLVQSLPADELRWLIAHEVAHVRRRDHWVRWMEWLACIAFWWNPVTWVSRKYLRVNEEICTDALVLRSLQPNPKTYATSLLNAVEFLIEPLQRPPAMASEINSGGALEKRLKMILSKRSLSLTPRWVNIGVLLSALVLLPLGVAHAQEPNTQAVAKRLIAAVHAGEISEAQAKAMMGALAEARFAEQLAAAKVHKMKGTAMRDTRVDPRKAQGGMSDKYHQAGVSHETYTKVMKRLHEEGVKKEVLEPTMAILLHSIYATRKNAGEGVYEEMAVKMTELGLTRPQSELVFRLAKKLADALDQHEDQMRADPERVQRFHDVNAELLQKLRHIEEAMKAGKISREEGQKAIQQIKVKLEVLHNDMNAEMDADLQRRADIAADQRAQREAIEAERRAVEEADRKAAAEAEEQRRRDYEDIMATLEQRAKHIEARLKAGVISQDDAHKELVDIRMQMVELSDRMERNKRN